MKTSDQIKCDDFPCTDIDTASYVIPYKELNPQNIKMLLITEAPPPDKKDYFYAEGTPFYLQTTVQAFNDAGFNISSMQDILDLGVCH